jgi:hypothetical protein
MINRNNWKVSCVLASAALLFTLGGCGDDSDGPSPTLMGGSIQKVPLKLTTAVSTVMTNYSGAAVTMREPYGITTDGTNLYVAHKNDSVDVRKIVIATGKTTTLSQGAFSEPTGITTDGKSLFVCDRNGKIQKIALSDGSLTLLAGSSTQGFQDGTGAAAKFNQPYGITTDGTNVYVAERNNHTIRKIVIATGVVTTIAGHVPTNEVQSITLSGVTAGTFTITYGSTSAPIAFNASTVDVTAALTPLIGAGEFVVTGVPGAWIVTFQGTLTNRNVTQMTADGTGLTGGSAVIATTTAGGPVSGSADNAVGTLATFNEPRSITTDGKNLYVGDWNNFTIRKVVIATGTVTTLAGTVGEPGDADGIGTAATFYGPRGISTDGYSLYVADHHGGQPHTVNPTLPEFASLIRKVDIATGKVTTIAGVAGTSGADDNANGLLAKFNQPSGITTDGKSLFVADRENGTVRKIQ